VTAEDPELTPAQEDVVRRRLAAARADEQMPAAVVQRLDRVLLGLADERVDSPAAAPVVDLAARRRRRRVTQVLVAASAVVAVGFGFETLTSGTSGGGDASAGSDSAERAEGSGAGSIAPAPPTSKSGLNEEPVAISSATFRRDVIALDTDLVPVAEPSKRAGACLTPATEETAVAVTYDGAAATLLYRAPVGAKQRVDLYSCRPPGFLRSVLIPSR
jgi:hypothetical protein